MIICPHCGQHNADNASVCERCGQTLDAGALPPPRLLAQIQGLIPPEPIISMGKLSGDVEIPPIALREEPAAVEDLAAAQAAEPEPEPEPEPSEPTRQLVVVPPPPIPPPPPRRQTPSRQPLIIGLLAMLLALIGLWQPTSNEINAPRRPSVETAFTYIEILPPRPVVLLAWDYEPTTEGEMQMFAVSVLRHLYQKRARIANVSLRPTGPAVAADAMALVSSTRLPGVQAARPQPVEFGFIPGDAAALRSLSVTTVGASNLPELSAQALGFSDSDSLASFDLIIEFSAETATTQEWVEQIATRLDVPLIVAASGAVAPVLRPYEQTQQIAALMSGYTDALAYERLISDEGPATSQRMPQTLLHLLLIAIVCIALLRSLLR